MWQGWLGTQRWPWQGCVGDMVGMAGDTAGDVVGTRRGHCRDIWGCSRDIWWHEGGGEDTVGMVGDMGMVVGPVGDGW